MPWVNNSKCKGCHICLDSCPVNEAITARNKSVEINQEICTRCGICMDACPEGAIRPNSENSSLRGQKPFGAFNTSPDTGRGFRRQMSEKNNRRNIQEIKSGKAAGFSRNGGGGRGRR